MSTFSVGVNGAGQRRNSVKIARCIETKIERMQKQVWPLSKIAAMARAVARKRPMQTTSFAAFLARKFQEFSLKWHIQWIWFMVNSWRVGARVCSTATKKFMTHKPNASKKRWPVICVCAFLRCDFVRFFWGDAGHLIIITLKMTSLDSSLQRVYHYVSE